MLRFTNVLAFVLIVISAFVALASIFADAKIPKSHQLTSSYSYRQYLADANKQAPVDPLEYAKREKIFVDNLKEVLTHNSNSGSSYKKGINHMADWTPAERKRLNGAKVMTLDHAKKELQAKPYHSFHKAKSSSQAFPVAWDWRNIESGRYLTAPKNQGFCGSCWAHGSTETLESHYAIATGELFVLSQQQVTSCAPNPNECGAGPGPGPAGGCDGSIAQLAYEYVINNGGITEEWQMPYTSYFGDSGKCDIPAKSKVVAKFSGFKTVATNDQASVMDALLTGPLAINVDASTWHLYEGGIFDGCNYANNITIDHVVQLTGWGTDAGLNKDYWVVRNSWSASFGENGYIRVLKQDTPACGWNVHATDGTACRKGPNAVTQQWACGQCGLLMDTSYPTPSV